MSNPSTHPPAASAGAPAWPPLPPPDWAAIDAYAAEMGLWDPADIWSLSDKVCRERGLMSQREDISLPPRLRLAR